MRRKIIKTGNSLAVTIPADFAKEIGAELGDEVRYYLDKSKNRMEIFFLRRPKQISLFMRKGKTMHLKGKENEEKR
jgi:antitoxin component of MazEF toxin-antitoxin module